MLIGVILAAWTLLLFHPVQHYGFVTLDDGGFVFKNVRLQSGLTADGIRWAFSTTHTGNWHPLTWLTLLVDHEIFGLYPGGYHWTNLILHLGAVVLLFLALNRMTGQVWAAALAALLFGIHPLRVESVAWISERKDVLCALFWMLTLWTYARYAEKSTGWRYAAVTASFVAALLSKPMAVTLPLILLLLDFWPLRRLASFRFGWTEAWPLLREKIPLLILSAAAALLAMPAQGRAVSSFDFLPLSTRAANAVLSFVRYLQSTFWPSGLAVFYPYDRSFSLPEVTAAAVLIAAISTLAWRARAKAPYLLVGWIWYLLTLLPVIGLIQVGEQARADRYTYLPHVGIILMAVWGISSWAARSERLRRIAFGMGLAVAGLLSILTWVQLDAWRDGESLFRHAIAATKGNYFAHNNLGLALMQQGRYDEAEASFTKALEISPRYASAYSNRGNSYTARGRFRDAIADYDCAIRIRPDFADAHYNLGIALLNLRDLARAQSHLQKALEYEPDMADAHNNLGVVLSLQGNIGDAARHFREALRLDPALRPAARNLGALPETSHRP